jgi:hypothetical protein
VCDFNIPLSSIDKSYKQNNQQRNLRVKLHHISSGVNRHVQTTPSNNYEKHIFFQQSIDFSPKMITFQATKQVLLRMKKIELIVSKNMDWNWKLKSKETAENVQTHGD